MNKGLDLGASKQNNVPKCDFENLKYILCYYHGVNDRGANTETRKIREQDWPRYQGRRLSPPSEGELKRLKGGAPIKSKTQIYRAANYGGRGGDPRVFSSGPFPVMVSPKVSVISCLLFLYPESMGARTPVFLLATPLLGTLLLCGRVVIFDSKT